MSLLSRDLTTEEREALERLAGSRTEEYRLVTRARIVLAAADHSHMCDVVRLMNTDKHTVRRWADRFIEHGLPGLRDHPRCGAPHTFTPEQVSKLVLTALTPPKELGLPFGSWTQQRLSDYLAENEGFRMSQAWVGELLHREGLRWKTDETWMTEKVDPAFLEKRGRLSSYTGKAPKEAS